MLDWITETINSLGYWGILALMALENIIPPIPSELIMPLAGFVSGRSELQLSGVILAGAAGSVLGTLPWYYLGRLVPLPQLLRWVDRWGRWVAVSSDDLQKAMRWFKQRRGSWVVGLARLVPGIRTYVSVPAGISRMGLVPYLIYSFAGTLFWVALLAIAGYILGDRFEQVQHVIGPISKAVLIAVVVGSIVWALARHRRKRSSGADQRR